MKVDRGIQIFTGQVKVSRLISSGPECSQWRTGRIVFEQREDDWKLDVHLDVKTDSPALTLFIQSKTIKSCQATDAGFMLSASISLKPVDFVTVSFRPDNRFQATRALREISQELKGHATEASTKTSVHQVSAEMNTGATVTSWHQVFPKRNTVATVNNGQQVSSDQRAVTHVPREMLDDLKSRVIHYMSEAKNFSAEVHQIAGKYPQLVLSLDGNTDELDSSLLEAANIARDQVKKTPGKRPSSGNIPSKTKCSRQSEEMESLAIAGASTTRSPRSGRAVSNQLLEGVAQIKTEPMNEMDENANSLVEEDHEKTRTILVQNIPPSMDEEVLELFFESKKKKGGGPVKHVKLDREKNWAIVEFLEPEAVDVVLSKTPVRMLDMELDIQPYVPMLSRDEHLTSLDIRGLPSKLTEDILTAQLQSMLIPENQGDSRAEITYNLTIENISRLKTRVFSPNCMVRNLPWKIMAMQNTNYCADKLNQKALGIFLQCNAQSKSKSWSCNASAELKVLSQMAGGNDFVKKIQHKFCKKETEWGFSNFLSWNDLLDPDQGYIKDDTVTIQVHVKADPPVDIR